MKKAILAIILSLALCECGAVDQKVYNIKDFQRTYFHIINKQSDFYRVNTGLENNSPRDILATGYISKDVNVDVIMVDRETQKLIFYIYKDDDDGTFKQEVTLDIDKKNPSEQILNVHFIELVDQNLNSIVIISKYKEGGLERFRLVGYSINQKHTNSPIELGKISNFDYDYAPGFDFAGEPLHFQTFNRKDNKDLTVFNYWIIVDEKKRKVFTFDESKNQPIVIDFTQFFNPNPSAKSDDVEGTEWVDSTFFRAGGAFHVADLNLDCRADIILESFDPATSARFLEIYYFEKNSQFYQLVRRIGIDPNYTSPRLVDLRQANILDLVFYNREKKSLDIFLSTRPNPDEKSNKVGTYCLDGSEYNDLYFPDIKHASEISLKINTSYSYRLVLDLELYQPDPLDSAPNFQFVDFNMNGYVDLAFVKSASVENSSGGQGQTGKMTIFQNLACTPEQASSIYPGHDFEENCRIFKEQEYEDYNKTLQSVDTDRFGLFDFGERGIIGFFLISYDQGKANRRDQARAVYIVPQLH